MSARTRIAAVVNWRHRAAALWTTAGTVALAGLVGIFAIPGHADDLTATNIVEQYQQRLNSGTDKLAFAEDGHGYLPGLLDALHIPRDSQLLVFSASSMQFDRINQKEPRALYYDDNVSVGAVQGGRFIELIAADKKTGVAFYTLDVTKTDKPEFVRRTGECMICHGFTSRWAPGMMVANYDTGPGGKLINLDPFSLFHLTDDRTPFKDRYGGWYVTGNTGTMQHRGNVTIDPDNPSVLPSGGLNVASLSDRIDTKLYLEPGSDIVSLLTLEHQTGFVNLVTQINGQYRGLNNTQVAAGLRATQKDIDTSIDELVAYMTFVGEVPLPSPVTGTSTFAKTFADAGPQDPKKRSLRQFDLQTRVFHYPLSYMIYSQTFDDLNPLAKERVLHKLYDVLRGADNSPAFAALKTRDGAAAINIVAATKAGLPDYWKPIPETATKKS